MSVWMTFVLAALVSAPDSTESRVSAPAIGAVVPNVTLKDTHRRPRTLADYKDKRALVVVFIGTECPLANLWLPTLTDLQVRYAEKGVQVLAINSNSQDTFLDVAAHAHERNLPFPVLKDFDHRAAEAFGAERTPEAFVLDEQRTIRYHGRIDDQYGLGTAREKPNRSDLREALDELLAGNPVRVATTDAPGCIIGRAEKPRVDKPVTYSGQVAKIVQERCQSCHRQGQIGPMALTNYDDVKSWSQTIREVVLEQRMPPWHAHAEFGQFSNERRLSRAESDTLLAWVEQGCQQGDERELPPAPKFTAGWTIGTPDQVFAMPTEFEVPATGVVDYQRFTVDPGFKQDVWVQAAECLPGNRAVVHHILVYIREPGKQIFAEDGTASTLAGWAPGDMPAVFPPGIARRIPAGAKFVFEVHYTPNGQAQSDRSSVGLVFAKQPPEREVETNILANMRFKLPPRTANYQSNLTYTFPRNAQILSFMPHLHVRGSSARYDVKYPDGRRETLLYVPDYDFNWQSVYRYKQPLRIPQGTVLTMTCWWDNSADNPRNPDPNRTVGWGEQTWDEMQNGWMDLVWEK